MFILKKKLLAVIKSSVIGLLVFVIQSSMSFVSADGGDNYCSVDSPSINQQTSTDEETPPEDEDPEC